MDQIFGYSGAHILISGISETLSCFPFIRSPFIAHPFQLTSFAFATIFFILMSFYLTFPHISVQAHISFFFSPCNFICSDSGIMIIDVRPLQFYYVMNDAYHVACACYFSLCTFRYFFVVVRSFSNAIHRIHRA